MSNTGSKINKAKKTWMQRDIDEIEEQKQKN